MPEPWVERHRPKRLDQIVGNAHALADLRRWADAWKTGRPDQPAVLLSGPPGCGKTSAAHALAAEYGWELIELNASDARSAPAIQRVAGQGSLHQTFSSTGEYQTSREGKRKLIVLDEADSLYERRDAEAGDDEDLSDRGGRRAIAETVLRTQQPVVLIANDAYEVTRGSGERMGANLLRIPFRRPSGPVIRKVLRDVAAAEGVAVAEDVLNALATGAEGDLRSALNDLEALSMGRSRVESLGGLVVGQRNRAETTYDAVATVLKSIDPVRAIEAARSIDEPPEFLLAWLDENVAAEYRHAPDLHAALQWLARADVYLGRTLRRQYFALWGYATEVMAAGVATSKTRTYATPPRYQFPSWIRRMSSSKGMRGIRQRLGEKVGAYLHMGGRPLLREQLPALGEAARRRPEFAEAISLTCDLEEDEIRHLLKDASAAYQDEVIEHVERRRAQGPKGQAELSAHAEPKETKAPKPARSAARQSKSLTDF